HARPALWASVYLQGLLLDGERKSIEPLSRRVVLPDGLNVKDPDQALQQFVSPTGHYPLALRLYLPDNWLKDKRRLGEAGVPRGERRALTKPEIALDL